MGWGPGYYQVGYDAVLGINPSVQLSTSISYSEDNVIYIAYFDNQHNATPNFLDTSLRTDNSADLIIGFDGNDTIRGGGGRDYLYGSIGNDVISGGSGSDVLHGGDRTTVVAFSGPVPYSYGYGAPVV
jgi:Ca2+-binding RTX toxin-like protein